MALASLLQQPVQIDNIRARRSRPGLKNQHLAGVQALAEITEAELQDSHLHSTRLTFVPRTIKGGKYHFAITTAGSACLLFNAVLPPLLFARQASEVTITGGTHVPWSPPFQYLDTIFAPMLAKLGGIVKLTLERWGFYPRGGGVIRAIITPCSRLQAIRLQERGRLLHLKLSACSSLDLPEHINRRELNHLTERLSGYRDLMHIESLAFQSYSPGNFVFLETGYENTAAGFSALGKRGRPAEEVAQEVGRAFNRFAQTPATTDSHLSDQMILYMALAQGDSSMVPEKTTDHLTTNIDIIKKFLPVDIEINPESRQISVVGCGFMR